MFWLILFDSEANFINVFERAEHEIERRENEILHDVAASAYEVQLNEQ